MSQIARTYNSTTTAELRAIYDDWAASYDSDLADAAQDYVAPRLAAAHVLNALGPDRLLSDSTTILDAGCGTGLVGVELARIGARNIDGLDLSPGMIARAKATRVYRSLEAVDLSKKLDREDGSYDVVVCVGTMTQGHLGPEALDEFLRVVSGGGFVVATILEAVWESGGYKKRVEGLVEGGRAEVVYAGLEDYRRGAGVQARMLILRAI